jgi:hypothetical protein
VKKKLETAARLVCNRKEDTILRVFRKNEKIRFEDAVKFFNFSQFYEICKIFGVDVVDREVFDVMAAEAKEQGKDMDLSKVKMRRDFEVMTNELIAAYNKLPRRNRRQIDPIISKIVWGNKRANQISQDRIVETYNAALANMPNIVNDETSVDENTVDAAAASESDN